MALEADAGREAWMLLFQLFRSHRGELAALHEEVGLNQAQFQLLMSLEQPDGSPMGELAEALGCDNSYITGLVDKLEDRGLVRRLPSPKDRRVKLVALTEAGELSRAQLKRRLSQPPSFIQALADQDKRALRDIFLKASRAVQDTLPSPVKPEPDRR